MLAVAVTGNRTATGRECTSKPSALVVDDFHNFAFDGLLSVPSAWDHSMPRCDAQESEPQRWALTRMTYWHEGLVPRRAFYALQAVWRNTSTEHTRDTARGPVVAWPLLALMGVVALLRCVFWLGSTSRKMQRSARTGTQRLSEDTAVTRIPQPDDDLRARLLPPATA